MKSGKQNPEIHGYWHIAGILCILMSISLFVFMGKKS